MVEKAILRLIEITEKVPVILLKMKESEMSAKPLPEKWSKKEIIGHLIDSAANNHQRFVRGQFEDTPHIEYDQNKWNKYGYYQEIDCRQLILFWTYYNKQLIDIIKRIPDESLKRKVKTGENLFTLEFLITDYISHLEHHLKQVTGYKFHQ